MLERDETVETSFCNFVAKKPFPVSPFLCPLSVEMKESTTVFRCVNEASRSGEKKNRPGTF